MPGWALTSKMEQYKKAISNDSGTGVDLRRKSTIDELLNLIDRLSIGDIEGYVESIRSTLSTNLTTLPVELQQKIMRNLDYKSLSRLRQVNKTTKAIAETLVRKNVTEQISVELLDKIICLPYFIYDLGYYHGQLSGRKDVTITGDKYGDQFVGPVKLNGSINITIRDDENGVRTKNSLITGEGYFDADRNPHFKIRDQFDHLFWNEDNRYIYFTIYDGGMVSVREVKRSKYFDDELQVLRRSGELRPGEEFFYTSFNNKWVTDLVQFDSLVGPVIEYYKIIDTELPRMLFPLGVDPVGVVSVQTLFM